MKNSEHATTHERTSASCKPLLNGKIALVTGASGGIGGAIAQRLSMSGATVLVHYGRHRERALETAAKIERSGGKAFCCGADLSNIAQITELFKNLSANGYQSLDILVNNAGAGLMDGITETSEADFDHLININVKGPFFLTKAAMPRLRGGGAIINISSMVSIKAYPSCIAYALSKAALNSMTASLASELGPRQIRVNAIAVGVTETDFIPGLKANQEFMQAIESATALGRIGQPDDIAAVVEFLASPAGAWITGQVLQASGGMHL